MRIRATRAAVRRPRRRGVDVRPGSIKEARLSAGLSLAQLASGQLTRAAVHLVEHGRSRPSMQTLDLIARRTGKPLDFFLLQGESDQFAASVSQLERFVQVNAFEEANQLAIRLLEQHPSIGARAEILYLMGRSLFRLGRGGEAEKSLRDAVELYEQRGDRWGAVEARQYLAKVLALQERPEAMALAREALAECRALTPVPEATQTGLLEAIAVIHLQRHEWEDAVSIYDELIALAGPLRDVGHVAEMYDNLAIAYTELRQFERAHEYALKALALTQIDHDKAFLMRIENNLGFLLTKRGQFDAAESHLREALRLAEETGMDQSRAHVYISLGELWIARRSRTAADDFLQHAVALAARLGESLSEATAHERLADSALLEADFAVAESEFRLALALLERDKVPARLRNCRIAYARMLRARGRFEDALDQWEAVVGSDNELPTVAPTEFVMAG